MIRENKNWRAVRFAATWKVVEKPKTSGATKKSKADDGEETRQGQEGPEAFVAQVVAGNPLRLEPRWNLTWIKEVLSLHLVSPQHWMESRWPFGVQTRGDRSEAALRGGPDRPARAQHDAYRRQVLEQS